MTDTPARITTDDACHRIAAWFAENTDPTDGQWGSASDFIEHAADALTLAGFNLDTGEPPTCTPQAVELILDADGVPTCPKCGGQTFGYEEGCTDYRSGDEAGPGYVRCTWSADGTAESGDSDPGWFCDHYRGGGCGQVVTIPDSVEEVFN